MRENEKQKYNVDDYDKYFVEDAKERPLGVTPAQRLDAALGVSDEFAMDSRGVYYKKDMGKEFKLQPLPGTGVLPKDAESIATILGDNANLAFAETVGSHKFEYIERKNLYNTEVLAMPDSPRALRQAELRKEHTKKVESLEKEGYYLTSGPKAIGTRQVLKDYKVEEWVYLCCSLGAGVPSMVAAIDCTINRIAYEKNRYQERNVNLVHLMDTMMELMEHKEMLLNIYVLNKIFAGLVKTKEEQEVFLCVIQKSKPSNTIDGAKLRTAYRTRRNLIRRFREWCLVRGYTSEWFYDHFADVPAVRYACENVDIKKRVAELDVNRTKEQAQIKKEMEKEARKNQKSKLKKC